LELVRDEEYMIMDEEVQGLKSQIGGLTSSNDARVSRLMEVKADLQLQLDAKNAERDAAMEAAKKAEREREAPRRKRERAALQQRCERLEEQYDDFKRQLREKEIALASKQSVDVDGCIGRAVARHASEIEQLTSERAALDDELASLREAVKKANASCEWCRSYNQRVRDDAKKERNGGGRARTSARRGRE
jgi:uncharacterized protein YukE